MRKLFYGVITFLYVLVLSKYGTLMTTEEFLKSLFSGRPSDVTTLFMAIGIGLIVAMRTNNDIKEIKKSNIFAIIILAGLMMLSFDADRKIIDEQNYKVSKDLSSKNIIEEGLLIDNKTKQLVNGTIKIFFPKTNKIQYEITFTNGKPVSGIQYKQNGEGKEMTNAHFHNMGFKI